MNSDTVQTSKKIQMGWNLKQDTGLSDNHLLKATRLIKVEIKFIFLFTAHCVQISPSDLQRTLGTS